MVDPSSDSPSRPATILASDRSNHDHSPAPASAQAQPRRQKPRNRKNDHHPTPPLDGTVSDGALPLPSATPRSKKAQHHKQHSGSDATSSQPNDSMGRPNGQRSRPISVGGNLGTPAKEQAYAGATFQASPAPSSLPMPKFISRSVPNVANQASLAGRPASKQTPPELHESSPESDVVVPHSPSREDQKSPLDIFFKADRAEREKSRSASGLLSPRSPASPRFYTPNERPTSSNRKYEFMSELDGHGPSIISPRATPVGTSESRVGSSDGEKERLQAQTDSLKAMLFKTAAQATATPPPVMRSTSGSPASKSPINTPSPLQRSYSGPVTPQARAEGNDPLLHYGNRNLSPMFKAARVETPPRPSNLRREVPGGSSADVSSTIDITGPVSPPPTAPRHSNGNMAHRHQNQHAPFTPAGINQTHSGSTYSPYGNGNGVQWTGGSNQAAPPASPKQDRPTEYQTIEDELRRVLKLK